MPEKTSSLFSIKRLSNSLSSAWSGRTRGQKAPFMYAAQNYSGSQGGKNYTSLAQSGYESNVIVYRCINLIARSISSVPLVLLENDVKVTAHPLLNLLKKANPMQNGTDFLEAVTSFLLLSGNAYIEAIGDNDGKPKELYALRPDRIKITPGKQGLPKNYTYAVQGQKREISVDAVTGQCNLLHLKFFHANNDWYGFSPIEAAMRPILSHSTVSSHNLSLLENGGRPSGALFLKNNGHAPLSLEQKESLRESLKELYQGSKQAGQMMLLEGGFEWKEMGMSPKDMDFTEGKNTAAREISQAFGVPPMLIGVPGDATFSNYREARLHLWEDTILPLLDRILIPLGHWLSPYFSGNLTLGYDADAIPSIAAKREMRWEQLEKCSFLTNNEKRQELGYPAIESGDVLPSQEVSR